MKTHTGHSAAYEQIAALIARNDLHTAEVLWNKRRDSLTGEERQALSAVLERKECRARRRRHRPWLLLAMALAGGLLLGAVCFWLGSAGAGSPFWTALTAALAGAGGILARMCYRMYLWTGPDIHSQPAEVVALRRRKASNFSPRAPVSWWVYQAVLRPLGQAGGREKTGSWEVVVPVFSEWDYSPVERGGENRVTHNTLRCGEIVTLYRNRKGKWSLTRYSRRSLARYYLKHLAGWTAAWSAILLVLTLGGSGL